MATKINFYSPKNNPGIQKSPGGFLSAYSHAVGRRSLEGDSLVSPERTLGTIARKASLQSNNLLKNIQQIMRLLPNDKPQASKSKKLDQDSSSESRYDFLQEDETNQLNSIQKKFRAQIIESLSRKGEFSLSPASRRISKFIHFDSPAADSYQQT